MMGIGIGKKESFNFVSKCDLLIMVLAVFV